MNAIAVERGEHQPSVIEVDRPSPDPGEALLRTLRVGIDGTDHEVIDGNHGGFPTEDDYQILGHEAVAVVEDANGTGLREGSLVVPTVRRPIDTPNNHFERGEPDMAPEGTYVERGIVGAHGYMAEYVTSQPEYLVSVPDSFARHGFLVEPISNSEKAIEHAIAARSAFEWEPESALILGNGPLGLLTLAMMTVKGFDTTYCLGRRDRPDPTIDIIERLDGIYIDSRETPVASIPETYEAVDFLYEATGYAKHAFESIAALESNGVAALLGLPDDWTFEIDGGQLHRELVLHNKAVFGSVNSNQSQYEQARETLTAFPDWFVDALITDVYAPDDVGAAFETGNERIKTVIEFDTP
ncbi:glucose 1-dehydrogenase [Halocatena salina]|uniref:Glucose 1-dehydrogenase n=1 Tax=Halocatena salina TaxID=2934340 RepID=A0A8U0A7Y0_9EURY|nr:glucose 1-dehydrogenase [Halocatena salina]UPM44133.1 glucose 1-dehydrogenase [Halocatena salina]